MEHLKSSFEAYVPANAKRLILGSMPGDESLRRNEYYGHPRNRLWPILAQLSGEPVPMDYEAKKAFLAKHHIAVWDVVKHAVRKGSLDTSILNEEPNDLQQFLQTHPGIRTVGFNGQKAAGLFRKYFREQEHIRYIDLPSTSPANIRIPFDEMCRRWGVFF
jgi:hypoxanthine-DNA glycosylase